MIKSNIWNADLNNGFYKNPVLYADYSDPDAIRVGEDYFLISSSFSNVPGIPLLHSKDLVNWELVKNILLKIPGERYENPIHGCGVWAPSIRYHEGTFFVCFPMPDEGIYMTTAKDPYGKWSEPVNIRPGAGWIDPCPFWDDDGKAYLVAGVAKSRIGYKSVLHMTEMAPDGMSLIGEEKVVFDGNLNDQNTIEGPKLYKKNGWYYIFAPAGGVKPGWQTVLRSKNIYGPYEYKVVMRQGNSKINGPHQGAWVDTVTGEDWFLHFQDVYAAGRIVHLQPMHFENDWPVIGEKNGEYGIPVETYKKPNVGNVNWKVTEPGTSDDFERGIPGPQWQWNANPGDFTCDSKQGLKLKTKEKSSKYGDMPNLLLQKWPAPEFDCETTINLSGLTDGDEAGFISMGVNYGLVTFRKKADKIEAVAVKGEQHFGKILCESTDEEEKVICTVGAESAASVKIKYIVRRTGVQNLSESEKNFPLETVSVAFEFLNSEITAEAFSMPAVPGRWVGVKSGVFVASKKDSSNGFAMVESVVYSREV